MTRDEMQFRPISDVVAIRPDKSERKHGSVIIPECAERGQICEGTVVYCGPGDRNTPDASRFPMTVKPGDRVLYVGDRAGTWTRSGGEDLYVIHEEQFVLAVVE